MTRPEPKRLLVSYTREDESRVTSIVSHLRALGAPLAVEAVDARPGGAFGERLRHCGAVAAMISRQSAQSPWVRHELAHAIEEERASGRIKIIPCLLEECELPALLHHRQRCDFTRGLSPGLQRLVADIEREAEVVTVALHPALPLYIDAPALRTQLEAALLLGAAQTQLYFVVDAEALERELRPAWEEHAHRHRGSFRASFQSSAELLLRNLATCLGKAAAAAVEAGQSAAALTDALARSCALVLYEHWKFLRAALGAEALVPLQSLDARRALAEIERIDGRPNTTGLLPPPAMQAALFGCGYQQLVAVELHARTPFASGQAWLPRSALREETFALWDEGHVSPADQLTPEAWPRFAVPGLVRHLVWHWSMRLGAGLSQNAAAISFALEDFDRMGPG